MDEMTPIRHAFVDVLGGRPRGLAVYRSAVTGDAIWGFSDLDLLAFLR
jgi:hypothetical protein